ncbi:MAG TPA: hypothetical protein DGD08_15605 [Gemmatimonas aurantiaca]|uniref:Uncharacterized protein n=1 Tax=Gemmatimonas aurantiaca TaxID=173480 RepID=A0A3D4VBX9_9BACT|nr:hypothetical protein [Gemmatimonas aurantiaca]
MKSVPARALEARIRADLDLGSNSRCSGKNMKTASVSALDRCKGRPLVDERLSGFLIFELWETGKIAVVELGRRR